VTGVRSALIVACDGYADPGLRRLRAPASDARALEGVLSDPAIGGFDVRTLMNEPAYEVALAIEEFFADRAADDLLLLHLSCHGVKDEDGELHFAMANTSLRRLAATGVAAEFVNRRMNRSRSRRVVLLLDCCYAGAFERGMTARAGAGVAIESQFGGRGRAVITASSAMEYAFEGDELADANELAPSVFTSALVEGLATGDADRDQDGAVSLDELYDYIYDKVRTTTPHQTPGKWTFGVQGELVIARRARPVTQPAPLPPELLDAIDSPLAGVRGAVVQELSRLLNGSHAGRRLAARQALEELTGDDSRAVAAAATAALGAQDVPPEPAPIQAVPAQPALIDEPQPAPDQDPAPEEVLVPEAEPPSAAELASEPEPTPEVEPATDAEAPPVQASAAEAEPSHDPEAALQPERAPAPEPEPDRQPAAASATPAERAGGRAGQRPAQPGPVAGAYRWAGIAVTAAAVLLVVSLGPPLYYSEQNAYLSDLPADVWQTIIIAAAAAAAGIMLVAVPARRVVGAGVALGLAVAAPSGAVTDILVGDMQQSYGPGFWLNFAGCVIGTLAAGVILAALARGHQAQIRPRPPAGALPWLIIGVGCAGAVVLTIQALPLNPIPGIGEKLYAVHAFAFCWTIALAALMPAVAVFARPRTFAVALLAGWIADGLSQAVFYTHIGNSLFGLTLLVLTGLTIVFARTAPPAPANPAEPLGVTATPSS
jgi:Caspase domain